jgi:hypothetical protein
MPLAPMPMPAGGPPGSPGAGSPTPPRLPGSPAGGPGGPGGSPMVSPGGGAGQKAAAMANIRAVMRALQVSMHAFEPGSKEFQGLMRAMSALNPLFGQAQAADLGPAAIRQMASAQGAAGGGPGGPLAGAPPPGVASPAGARPPMPPPPGGGM